jgi:uncharacterized protein YqjF (DUF2071 family)
MWIMHQTWENLLFAHWPIPPSAVIPWLPDGLPLDTRDGVAWLGITPFRITGLRLRALPPLPGASEFPEINVRTYVVRDGRPGVFFFSLDAGSRLAVIAARFGYRLPYFPAQFSIERDGNAVRYANHRTSGRPADFAAEYEPIGPVMLAPPDSLAFWLTERYSLFTSDRAGLYRADIEHRQWPLQPARATIMRNTMADFLAVQLSPEPALLHFAARLDVKIAPLKRLPRLDTLPTTAAS